jgi:hypothetical protein
MTATFDVEEVLSKLNNVEKVSLLAGPSNCTLFYYGPLLLIADNK